MSENNPGMHGGTVVDTHAHTVPAAFLADLAAGRERFPGVRVEPHGATHTVAFAGGPPSRPIATGLLDAEARTRWQAEQGIDRQVLSGWLDLFGYQLDPEEGRDWAHSLSAHLGAHADERTVALATVPLQAPDAAAAMLVEHLKEGFPGVMMGTRAGERELDDPAYTPLWEAAHETGAVLFLHPGFGGAAPRYADFGLLNGLSRLEDTTVSMARLLYSGIPARYPGMRMVVAHGGAALPAVLGRLARNHAISGGSTADPLESFAHLYFDSVVFDPDTLRLLLAKAGGDHVMLGSDYPFPIGDLNPIGVVDALGCPPEQRAAVLGGTAQRLFPLQAPNGART